MKTSIKILVAAACLVLVALVYYDLKVRDAYQAGSYKDPYGLFTELNFDNFDEIDLSAGTAANIVVQQGPFNIKMDPTASGFVKLSQTSHTLHIDAAFPANFYMPRSTYVLIITCPHLLKFSADSRYLTDGKLVVDTLGSEDFRWRPTFIEGFKADSMSITGQHASFIILKDNNIKSLKVTMGLGDKSRSDMVIASDNQFGNADIDILNKSQLRLECTQIQNLTYRLADSARLIVTGTTQKMIKK
jgi:hypothetical protein